MKPSQRYVTLLATAAVVFAGPSLAQSDRPSTSIGTKKASADAISRITKDSVKERFTAKDLIGSAVYDTAGEKIGDITDIDLHGTVPGALASAYNADQAADRAADRANSPAATPAAPEPATRSSKPMSAGAETTLAQGTVFLSVGGVFGLGDDLVTVPLSQLSYNAASNRFELAMAKADVAALAKGEPSAGYAADATMPAATRAGKQSFADEATRVQNALASDPQTSAFAQKVTVISAGDSLEIRGIVDNKEQRKRLIDAARRSTSLDVDDKIDVRN